MNKNSIYMCGEDKEVLEQYIEYIASLSDEDAEEFLDINENCA